MITLITELTRINARIGDVRRVLENLDSVDHVRLTLDLHTSHKGYAIKEMHVCFKARSSSSSRFGSVETWFLQVDVF